MSAHEPEECPQCGFDEPAGEECPRCGIVFARYRGGDVKMPEGLYWPMPKEEPPRISEEDRRINRGSLILLLLMVGALAVWAETRSEEPIDLTAAVEEPVGFPAPGPASDSARAPSVDTSRRGPEGSDPDSDPWARALEITSREWAEDGGRRSPSPEPESVPVAPADRTTYVMGYFWLEQAPGFERGVRDALEQDRIVTLYVYTDWCPYCRQIEQNVLSDPAVQQCLAYSVKVKVNPDRGAAEKGIARRFGVRGYPRIYFFDPATGIFERAPGALDTGEPLLSACRRKIG